MCTALDGNGDSAHAMPVLASTVNTTAAIRNHLAMPTLSIFLLPVWRGHRCMLAGHWRRSGYVDNPGDRVKFRRFGGTASGIVANCRGGKAQGEFDGGCRRIRTASPGLARCGAAIAQAQRYQARALRSRSRADDADQESSRRSV